MFEIEDMPIETQKCFIESDLTDKLLDLLDALARKGQIEIVDTVQESHSGTPNHLYPSPTCKKTHGKITLACIRRKW